MNNPEALAALPVPQDHLVSPFAVNHMMVYILGCQPEIVQESGSRSNHGETPDNINSGCWERAWKDQGKFYVQHGLRPAREHEIRVLTLSSRMALEQVSTERLVVPQHFFDLQHTVWQYINDYFLSREVRIVEEAA